MKHETTTRIGGCNSLIITKVWIKEDEKNVIRFWCESSSAVYGCKVHVFGVKKKHNNITPS